MPAATPKFTLANLMGAYAYQLVRPGLTKMGTVTFDGAGNCSSTDMDVPGEVRQSTGNGLDYTVSATDGSGTALVRFHAQQGGPFGPWFNFIPVNNFRKLLVVSQDGTITGTLEAQ